ncbi:MAG: hypothetical protein KJZ86_16060 [Caldilineaceae bacterium]|nr:hypothetical protein [Caldilineaceae bacterium]
MKKEAWQEQSQWIALALSGCLMAIALGLTLLWPASVPSLTAPEPVLALPSAAGYESPQRCRECHEEVYQAWSQTSHANALFDPIVRTYMQTIEQPGECFACHTTGYNTNTGQFVLAGVTCEACHGPYRPQHPQESMAIATSPDFCGSCHSSTRAEWESSRHGQIGVICLDCHEVHTQHTRTSTVEQNLCAICHQAEIQDEIHQAHAAVALGCIDCHLDRSHRTIPINGETATGHSFAATGDNCDACHIDR